MEFEVWEPIYQAILTDFGFPRVADERARDELVELLSGSQMFDSNTLDFAGASVAVAGGASSLRGELDVTRHADRVVAASTAADVLRMNGIDVDLVVTDLDKHPETVRECTREGVPVAVHAHGDNRDLIREVVPTLDSAAVLGTTQAEPSGPVRNFGGFTDGDRAAFLADHLGARNLKFPGWDFDDSSVNPTKREKLVWAERLLDWLERRRDEHFGVLDARRNEIDISVLPVE